MLFPLPLTRYLPLFSILMGQLIRLQSLSVPCIVRVPKQYALGLGCDKCYSTSSKFHSTRSDVLMDRIFFEGPMNAWWWSMSEVCAVLYGLKFSPYTPSLRICPSR